MLVKNKSGLYAKLLLKFSPKNRLTKLINVMPIKKNMYFSKAKNSPGLAAKLLMAYLDREPVKAT